MFPLFQQKICGILEFGIFFFLEFLLKSVRLRKQKVANYQVLCSIVKIYAFFFWYFCVPCTETGTGYITVPLSPAEGPLAQRLRYIGVRPGRALPVLVRFSPLSRLEYFKLPVFA